MQALYCFGPRKPLPYLLREITAKIKREYALVQCAETARICLFLQLNSRYEGSNVALPIPVQCIRMGLSPRVERPWAEARHSPAPKPEVKNVWS
jgi:hypothetical protein